MRLVEKECPNCGANIGFEEDAKTCKCEYCKTSFSIEKENTASNSVKPKDFRLNRISLSMKIFGAYWLVSFIGIGIITFIIFFITILFFIFGLMRLW